MWPFSRKRGGRFRSPVDRKSYGASALTDEEKAWVDKELLLFKDRVVDKQVAEQFRRLVTARGLGRYASRQTMMARVGSEEGRRSESIEKAIAAIAKAYDLSCLPLYLYDMATFVEMSGRVDAARNLFQLFLDDQAAFVPDQLEAAFMSERDSEEMVKDARRKVGLSVGEQYPGAAATSAEGETTTCERCGGEIRPAARFCDRCGSVQSAGRMIASALEPAALSHQLDDHVSRRSPDGANLRVVFGIISVVVFGVISLVVVLGLTRHGARSDDALGAKRVSPVSEEGRRAVKRSVGAPSAKDMAHLLDAEKAHTVILEGMTNLHKWLARENANEARYRGMIQTALDDMRRAAVAQRAAEDSGQHLSLGNAYRAWLECVEAEVDAFTERYHRGDIGPGTAAKEEALAPLDAAVAGYDAAYQSALALPSAQKQEPPSARGESDTQDRDVGVSEGASQGPGQAEPGPETDQISEPEHPENPPEAGNPDQAQP